MNNVMNDFASNVTRRDVIIHHTLSWDTKILPTGDVMVTLTERHHDKNSITASEEYTVKIPSDQIIEFIEKNCQHNPFYQVNLEGKLDRLCHEYQDTIIRSTADTGNTVIVPGIYRPMLSSAHIAGSDQTISELAQAIAFYRALLAVFRSSPRYDSPYGGGRESVFNVLEYIRPSSPGAGGSSGSFDRDTDFEIPVYDPFNK